MTPTDRGNQEPSCRAVKQMTAAAFVASGNAHAVNQTAAHNDSIPPADQCRISVVFRRVRRIATICDDLMTRLTGKPKRTRSHGEISAAIFSPPAVAAKGDAAPGR